ncbi:Uncharacterized protein GBIM_15757 [Gryllus bimaculatus]|nr:Uncharacterized protein GBIM_15757 [Gryllus bimaculatus]
MRVEEDASGRGCEWKRMRVEEDVSGSGYPESSAEGQAFNTRLLICTKMRFQAPFTGRRLRRQLFFVSVVIAGGLLLISTNGDRSSKVPVAAKAKDRARVPGDPPALVVHLDLKGSPPTMPFLKSFLELIAEEGADGLLLEYEDTFPFEGHLANLSAPHAYTKEQVLQLLEWAAELRLQVIPLVQTFGHLEYALKLPEFSHLRESKESMAALCPLHTGTMKRWVAGSPPAACPPWPPCPALAPSPLPALPALPPCPPLPPCRPCRLPPLPPLPATCRPAQPHCRPAPAVSPRRPPPSRPAPDARPPRPPPRPAPLSPPLRPPASLSPPSPRLARPPARLKECFKIYVVVRRIIKLFNITMINLTIYLLTMFLRPPLLIIHLNNEYNIMNNIIFIIPIRINITPITS